MPDTDFSLPKLPAGAQRYDISQTYEWNYDHAPPVPGDFVTGGSRSRSLCGVDVGSPVAVAAGPLLNGRWVLHYASFGFDLLTYKTVRSKAWPCYPRPNLQPIQNVSLSQMPPAPLAVANQMSGSWAVSFGMPSKSPDLWRADIEATRDLLPKEKKLSVSVVATPEFDWTIDEVAEDYARCGQWAADSGADFVELNFSCPNVDTCDGQLYQNPEHARVVAERTRSRIRDVPILVKIGQVLDEELAQSLVVQLSPTVDALVMINCIPAQVKDSRGVMFDGQPRGIAGPAIRSAVLDQLTLFERAIASTSSSVETVGVGGVESISDVRACLARGANGVQIATAAMVG